MYQGYFPRVDTPFSVLLLTVADWDGPVKCVLYERREKVTGGGGGGPFLKESNVSRSPHKRHIFVFFVLLLPGHNI